MRASMTEGGPSDRAGGHGGGAPASDIQSVVINPLFGRLPTLMLGHAAALFCAVLAMVRIGGAWPLAFTLASTATLLARLFVLWRGRRVPPDTRPVAARRWRRAYEAVALLFAAAGALQCAYCIMVGCDPVCGMVGLVLTIGNAAVIASRNAGNPRFAMALLILWLLPMLAACLLFNPEYWPVALITAFFFITLAGTLRQHHADIGRLIAREKHSLAMQESLAAREADMRAIFDNAAAGVVEIDLTIPRIVRVNQYYCRMAGRTEAEMLGLSARDVTHPDDWPGEDRWLAPAEVGTKYYYEKRFLHPDGTIVWGRASACVMAVGPDGIPTRTVAIAHDCTEQKAAEAALRENEEMLRLCLEIGRVAAYRNDHRAKAVHCGLQTRLFHGFPTDNLNEPIPMADFLAMIVPEDRPGLIAALAAAQAAQLETTFFAYRINHPRDGVREFESRSRMTYDAQGQPLESIGVAIDVTERGEAEARIAHMAHHDPLTELPNRTLFNVRLSEALARARRGEQFALFCLDLDRFKDINDTLGHPIGDALLRAVTDRLRAGIRPTDTLARMGGDEFALIQSRLEQPGDAIALAERLIAALQEPFELEGYHVTSGSSIGIAVAPDDGTDGDSLLRRADMALYAAKAEGRGRFRLFERHMDAELQARRTLELDLRQALARDEFVLFYQPLVRAADGTLSGFEALLRWQHPTRGLVPPDQFIPQAESAGLLVPIGAWVLRDACIEAARWPHRARVAVNLSAMQVTGEALVDTVLAALRESGLDPKRLELEITETAMLQDTEVTLATLHELKALGVSIAMDDFGTGYSSLSYLQRFPFDKVKIDRSFTTHLGTRRESAAIVSAVIDLCGSLDMRTTAEGVETAAQFDALARIGCTEAQGYYFSRPRPAADIPAMIARVEELARQQPAVAAEAGGQDLWLRA